MIRHFRSKQTQRLFAGEAGDPAWRSFMRVARRKLLMIDAARSLDDLRSPPGNRLEALKGDRAGHHAIRINDQYRVCFRWTGSDAEDVEIVDYH
ncbi:type II toxin-antitoxin system RelE/ParE family toxin [Acidisoma sp. 7E03]